MAFTPPLKMTVTAVSNPTTTGALGGTNPSSVNITVNITDSLGASVQTGLQFPVPASTTLAQAQQMLQQGINGMSAQFSLMGSSGAGGAAAAGSLATLVNQVFTAAS